MCIKNMFQTKIEILTRPKAPQPTTEVVSIFFSGVTPEVTPKLLTSYSQANSRATPKSQQCSSKLSNTQQLTPKRLQKDCYAQNAQ